jgi:hypothetical protein
MPPIFNLAYKKEHTVQILAEIKLALISIISDAQKKIKRPPEKITCFFSLCTEQMADAETAMELAQSVRNLVEQNLGKHWLNPLWHFSREKELRKALLTVLDSDEYSLLNLLIKSSREDRKLIRQLESENAVYHSRLSSAGISPQLISEYERKLSSYRDRYDIDQRRIEGLSQITEELIEENTLLKDQTTATTLIAKISKTPGFEKLLVEINLSDPERALLDPYLKRPSKSEENPSHGFGH